MMTPAPRKPMPVTMPWMTRLDSALLRASVATFEAAYASSFDESTDATSSNMAAEVSCSVAA